MLKNIRFERFFDGIGEFHAGVGEKFYAVVVIRIVRSGNHNAGLKIILADQAGDAGSGDDARESDGRARLRETGGKESGDVRAGFARVHADEDVSSGMFADADRRARERPVAKRVASSSGGVPGTPRMPSVPKSSLGMRGQRLNS